MKEKKYLEFIDISLEFPYKRTKTFRVQNSNSIYYLGRIYWYSHWRRYIFEPCTSFTAIFDSACLKEIAEFIANLMGARKKK